ncbi:MAG: guanylate kinase [Rickettsiales bacterium]|nr:guanylate kinase [Rickettsiales bacterium]
MQFNKRRGMMFVLSSPSGAGKTSLSRALIEDDEHLILSISATTRDIRPGEEAGKDYFFLSERDFLNKSANDEFLEHAKVFDHHYGTPSQFVDEQLLGGTDVLFDIDWQGTQRLRQKRPDDLVSIFILPPSMEELEDRLRKRAQDNDETVLRRMTKASSEISHWDEYDYVIVNKDFDDSLEKLRAILMAERCKRIRRPGVKDFVDNL